MVTKKLTAPEIQARKEFIETRVREGDKPSLIISELRGTRFAIRKQDGLKLAKSIQIDATKDFEKKINKAKGIRDDSKQRIMKAFRKEKKLHKKVQFRNKFFSPSNLPIWDDTK